MYSVTSVSVRMMMNVCSRLLASFVLCCAVAADIRHRYVREKQSIALPCPPSVEGNVTWSRETNGSKVDILTADGDGGKTDIHDPDGRYSLLPCKSLVIYRVAVSDAGKYFCNSEPAVQLTVLNYAAPNHQKPALGWMFGRPTLPLLITFIIITIILLILFTSTGRCRFNRPVNEGKQHVYEEIWDDLNCQPTHELTPWRPLQVHHSLTTLHMFDWKKAKNTRKQQK
ncbi:uncharacterized protein LOC119016469 isoform X1 [Acanthopagrus latus]|uniref:uncharacterized protein LOC119016469 isoform X1 n=1 Tax=Acanthopagrus latus TaxID=8177 RepID=UPI00187C7284|nr:uncharacterized protein LOC119016469 isoform X1 [Acanthopagrus latus]